MSLSAVMLGLLALLHVYFAVLEMALWTKPAGRRVFGTTEVFAKESKLLAQNQGLYNLFLAAGLIGAVALKDTRFAYFFASCVLVAGLFGAATGWLDGRPRTAKAILAAQALPGALTLALLISGW